MLYADKSNEFRELALATGYPVGNVEDTGMLWHQTQDARKVASIT